MALNVFKKAASKSTDKPKKAGTPEFEITSPEAKEVHAKWVAAKKKKKEAEAAISWTEGVLLDTALSEHIEACQRDGKYYSSIKGVVNNNDRIEKVTISFTNRYSEISTEHEDDLRKIYGDDYDLFFEEKTVAKMTNKALEDQNFVQTILDAIGEENFSKFFDVKQYILPKKSYHETRMTTPRLATKHQEAVDAGLVSCNKPSVKEG